MDPLRLAPADLGIIQCLSEDPRSPVAKIASRLQMPESTVRHRLGRLIRSRAIEFTAVVNPLHLGFQIWTILEIQADLRKVRSVAERVAAAPEVYFVGLTTGGYDVLVGAVFRTNDALLEFITGTLANTPGIIRTTTSSVLQVVKRSLTFGVPNGVGSPSATDDRPTRGGRPRPRRQRRRASPHRSEP